ncbi:antitoxin VapB family protein [Candidatus Micrarchaeota archaeon]|nr:antitoxin VapB family protein [Candidatus Micrarchaeota archaeon]
MANIYVTDEAYARLKAAKSEDQSFSDWILENVRPQIDWDRHFGSCKGMDVKRIVKELQDERRRT